MGAEAESALTEVRSAENVSGENGIGMVGVSEVEVLAGLDFAAGANEGSPDDFTGVADAEIFGEKDFDEAGWAG